MQKSRLLFFSLFFLSFLTFHHTVLSTVNDPPYQDKPFIQEYHEAYIPGENSAENDVKSIAVNHKSNIWIATADGIFTKHFADKKWLKIIQGESRGPAYAVAVDKQNVVWLGTWNGLYSVIDGELNKQNNIKSPISVICPTKKGTYFLGPKETWYYSQNTWQQKNYSTAKSIRDAVCDDKGGLWIATDIGLYHCTDQNTELYQSEKELISAYIRGLDFANDGQLWAGGLGGVTIRKGTQKLLTLTSGNGIPSVFVNSVDCSPDGIMWVGTDCGVVRYDKSGNSSLRFSKRWLVDDKVRDVTFDQQGNAWIATAGGVSSIKRKNMTLAGKADYFYNVLMKRHIREPWIAGQCRLAVPGDTTTWQPEDDDNDGEYTGGYLAMESLRYAVTKDPDAKEKAAKAFAFLKFLREVTGRDGLFARTIVPADWKQVHDTNRRYTEKQLADELVRDPRYKPVENRWHPSKDGKWLWKGDTSSDEMCGHMMGYFYYFKFAADENQKQGIRQHVCKIMDDLVTNNYNLIGVDGTQTRWGVWSPDQLNRKPDWAPEKALNSFELLAYLKFVYGITGNQKYQNEYMRLINEEHYLENAKKLNRKNPAWYIYFDVTMAGYLFPILLEYEQDPEILHVYEQLFDEWFEKQIRDKSALNNLTYCFARKTNKEIQASVNFLIDTPLDLVDWSIDHGKREDIKLVRIPTLEEWQTNKLVPPSIRATVRWDKNPWAAVAGNPHREREPVFWLLPYWMGRYIGVIVE